MKRGISNLVAFVIIILITLTVASSFYYWYNSVQSEAKSVADAFSEDVSTQIISRAESMIDLYYKTDKEKNINNFAEVRQIICAEDRKLDTSEDRISLELYEGYGSDLKLICAVNDFDGSVLTKTDYLVGVLGGRTSATKGITGIKCSDTSCETVDWTSMSISSEFATHSNFSFYVLTPFIEGGDFIDEPRNLLLMGQGYDGSQFDAIVMILDQSFTGKSYDLFSGGTLADNPSTPEYPGAIRDFWQEQGSNLNDYKYFSRVGGQQIAGNCENHPEVNYHLCDSPGQDCCDQVNKDESIVTKFGKVYDSPAGGTFTIDGMKITEIVAITKIVRDSVDRYLIGGFVTEGDYSSITNLIGKLYELTVDSPPTYIPYSSCPYDPITFSEVLGITINTGTCLDDTYDDLFDKPSDMVRHGDNILIGVNNLNYFRSGPAGPCSTDDPRYPRYDDGTYCWVSGDEMDSCDITCSGVRSTCVTEDPNTWNDDALCSVMNNLGYSCGVGLFVGGCQVSTVSGSPAFMFPATTQHLPGPGPGTCYYREAGPLVDCTLLADPGLTRTCACDLSDFDGAVSTIPWFVYTPYDSCSDCTDSYFRVPGFGSVSATRLDNYNLTDILSDGNYVYLLLVNSSETAVYNLTVSKVDASVSAASFDSISGFYGKTLAIYNGILYVGGKSDTYNATIYKFQNNAFNSTASYTNGTYNYVEQLTNYTKIEHKRPYCSSGCNQELSRGECAELVLKLENTECDISSYSQGTSFTMRLNIGRFFQDLQIFIKRGFDSDEVNDTVV